MWCSYTLSMGRSGRSASPRISKSARNPSVVCSCICARSSSVSAPVLLISSSGILTLPTSCISAPKPSSYSSCLPSPSFLPSATLKMQTLTQWVKVYSS
jgi:hypothetical protein